MSTTDQPLEKPQDNENDDADFDSAFAEYATKDEGKRDEYYRDEENDDESANEEDDQGEGEPGDADNEGSAPAEPDVSQRLTSLEQENQRLKHSEASQRGRLGAYQRQINDLQRQLQHNHQQQPTNPDGKPQTADQQREELAQEMGSDDWKAFQEDFPDMARAFESRLNADRQRQAHLEQQIQQLQSAVQPIQEQAHEQQLQSEYARLESRHSDWRDVVNAPEYQTWLQQQNPAIQQLAESESADDASALLDFYKRMNGPAQQPSEPPADKRKDRLANAQTVSRRGAAQRSGAPEDFDAAFEHYAAKRSRQR